MAASASATLVGSARRLVLSAQLEWSKSPSATVLRRRLELDGPAEAGRVTSVVRYLQGSAFPRHEHPDGEEILVLSGVFSDAAGDHGAGVYILNPEGYSHAPRSAGGCDLLVKLRQYPGLARRKVRIDTSEAARWARAEGGSGGAELCALYRPEPHVEGEHAVEQMDLLRLPEGARVVVPPQPCGLELFVVAGAARVLEQPGAAALLEQGAWLKLRETLHGIELAAEGCGTATLYVKRNHLGADPSSAAL
jgi:hypothetical protein